MKSISAALLAHLKGGATTTATVWRVERTDGVIFGFTDLDRDIKYDDGAGLITYLASTGISPSSIDSTAELSVDNMEIQGILDASTITEVDLMAGIWDLADVRVYRVNYMDLSMGHEWLNRGRLGEIITGRNAFQAEMRSLTQNLQQQYSELVQPLCTAVFCDKKCKLKVSDYTFSGTVVGTSSQQTFITDLTQAPNFFAQGKIKFLSGKNMGLTQDIKFFSGRPNYTTLTQTSSITGGTVTIVVPSGSAFTRDYGVVSSDLQTFKLSDTPSSQGNYSPSGSGVYSFNTVDEGKSVTITYAIGALNTTETGQMDLQLEMPYVILLGDTFQAIRGCDHRHETCTGEFNNIINFRGFPHLPGRDRLISGKST